MKIIKLMFEATISLLVNFTVAVLILAISYTFMECKGWLICKDIGYWRDGVLLITAVATACDIIGYIKKMLTKEK